MQEEKSGILSQLSKNSAWHHATRTLQLRMVATDIDPQSIQRRRGVVDSHAMVADLSVLRSLARGRHLLPALAQRGDHVIVSHLGEIVKELSHSIELCRHC